MSVFLSLVAGCASGIGAALRNRMAHDVAMRRSWIETRRLDRALHVLFFFVCLAMAVAVLALILGLVLFVWDSQTNFVAGAMTASGMAFILAGGLSMALWVPPQSNVPV
jgi:hypothetical protein